METKTRKRKIVSIVVDGVGDLSCQAFRYKTPLETAHTPFLDALAECGVTGLMDSLEPGFACGSDTAHMLIFGYQPRGIYRGRGAFEALGGGLDMHPGDIAFKSNFCTYDKPTNMVITRRADRSMEVIGPLLAKSINGIAPGMSGNVTGTDPLVDYKPLLRSRPLDDTPEAKRTSEIINELSDTIYEILSQHPVNEERKKQNKNLANLISLRGPGIQITIPPFSELRPTIKPFVIAPTAIVAGVALTAQMDVYTCPGATGDYFTDFQKKAEFFAKMIEVTPYNYCFCHIKATDDTGHDGRPVLRKEIIERVDRMIGILLERLCGGDEPDEGKGSSHELILQLTADHSTPICVKDHSCEPPPLLICHLDHFKRRYKAVRKNKELDREKDGWKEPFDYSKYLFHTEDEWHDDDDSAASSSSSSSSSPSVPVVEEHEPDFRETGGITKEEGSVVLVPRKSSSSAVPENLSPVADFLAPDAVKAYAEVACAKGKLGRFRAHELMPFAERLINFEKLSL
ncbi:putative cofactor-independent phosphoglycerate mutase [Monocercomonoides exilis]|uniref:putative cofactor-independent phosphoglycerate mutase n=1 Tax=Monocercomonoides exilis TaxID=2049356 RepID=UPI003559BB85|nr:putative cofactor-independent phosphoglycerate mutase [Monocercomonoides exilis]|eukprot:MONOS_14507.1-p1 / transcript=MONOS_14507.1 / gene=MONOS_14507 / organism=Monocercomonoides_exilis_PA203 / gene_product=cofactor-independent phosphoglycerate mutase / transcript_product=cofactor-independent phosphoglycerate mutase / location=Mono_scaffold01015:4530-6872(-) / protein_length=513 / sequence_SO=supercontig / SO=protein_coding / is_pseudo=false